MAALSTACQNGRFALGPTDRVEKLYSDITRISIMANSPLLDVDYDSNPDGVFVRVYLYRQGPIKPVGGQGSITFHLISRRKDAQGAFVDKDLKTWQVSQQTMTQALNRDRFGQVCYEMELYWPGLQFGETEIYIRGEFVRPDGKICQSRPLSLIRAPAPPGQARH